MKHKRSGKKRYQNIVPVLNYETLVNYVTNERGRNVSKVYILYKEGIFSIEENVNVVAVFSSYASMLLWLKEQWGFESDVEDQDELGAYFSKHYTEDEVDYFLSYSVKDLIGETSHKTDKLVIKGR